MPNFISVAHSVAELAHGEKSRTQSLSHSPSLFDVPGTEAFASEQLVIAMYSSVQRAVTCVLMCC